MPAHPGLLFTDTSRAAATISYWLVRESMVTGQGEATRCSRI